MYRRLFLKSAMAQVLAISFPVAVWPMGENRKGENYGVSKKNSNRLTKIGRYTVEELRDHFKKELFEKTIPLWKKQGVDWKYGGYLPYINEKGEITSTQKLLYHQGRVLWLYSYFYNHFDRDEYHLRAAKAGFDFLTKYCLLDKYDWCTEVTREGKVVTPFFDIYASIYMILGLGEYYKATGLEEARDLAVKTAYRVDEIILSPQYQAQGHGPFYEPGTVRLGTWLHFLSTLTPLLRYTEDQGIEKIARMCVRYMLRYHWQPQIGLAFETLQRDMTPHPNDYLMDEGARDVETFHSLQAAWMTMEEGLREDSPDMFREGMNFGRSHLEKCWHKMPDGREGIIASYRPDRKDPFAGSDIVTPYVNREIFVLCMLALEHSHEEWAAEYFDRAFTIAYENNFVWPWFDTLHQPRGVMFCYEILNRMIDREGKVSDFLDGQS